MQVCLDPAEGRMQRSLRSNYSGLAASRPALSPAFAFVDASHSILYLTSKRQLGAVFGWFARCSKKLSTFRN